MSDEIRIDLKSDLSEGDKARKKLAEVEGQVRELKSSFEQGNVTLARYTSELKNLERQADRAAAALDKVKPGKLSGTERAGAFSRAGLLGANTLQDVIQGGPASGINNILGAANDRGIKALAGEALAAAGGIKVVAGVLGTVAVAAGAAFLTIDTGLKKAHLEWSDFGDVVGNMAPIKAAGEALSGVGIILKDWGVTAALDAAWDSVAGQVNEVANLTVGWDDATRAARKHKDEVAAGAKALKEYAEAAKVIGGFKSGELSEKEAQGKRFGQQLADAGGEKGINGLIDAAASKEAGANNAAGRLKATQDIAREVGKAIGGDVEAQARARARLGQGGRDLSGATGDDVAAKDDAAIAADESTRATDKFIKQNRKERQDKADKDAAEKDDQVIAAEDSARANKKFLKQSRIDQAEKATAGTGLTAMAEDAFIRNALRTGGDGEKAREMLEAQLKRQYMNNGLSAEAAQTAAEAKAKEVANKTAEGVNQGARALNEKMGAPMRMGVSDFARSVESAGAVDARKLLETNLAMKMKLEEIATNTRGGARAGP